MATRVRMHWAHAPGGGGGGGLAPLPSGALTLTAGADGAILAHHTAATDTPWWAAGGRGGGGGEPPAVELSAASAAHEAAITTLAVHPGGTLLATGDEDSYVRLFTLPPVPAGVGAGGVNESPGGEVADWGEAVALLAAPARFGRPVRALAFSPTGSLLAAAGEEPGVLKLIATADPSSQVSILRGSCASRGDEPIMALAFDPLGDYVLSVGSRGGVGIWGVDAGCLLTEADLAGRLAAPTCAAWTPDGASVLVGGDGGAVVIAREAWGVVAELEGAHDGADDALDREGGGTPATAAGVATASGASPFSTRSGVTAIAVSPVGGYVATGDGTGGVVVWHLATAEVVDRWRLEGGRAVRSLSWHPAAAALIVCDASGHWAVIGDLLPPHMAPSFAPAAAVPLVVALEAQAVGGRGRGSGNKPRRPTPLGRSRPAGDGGGGARPSGAAAAAVAATTGAGAATDAAAAVGEGATGGGWADAVIGADGDTRDGTGGDGNGDDDGADDDGSGGVVHRSAKKKRRLHPTAVRDGDDDDGNSDAGSGGGSVQGQDDDGGSDGNGGGDSSGSGSGSGSDDSDDGEDTIGSGSSDGGGSVKSAAAAEARRRIERALAAEAAAADSESEAPALSEVDEDGGAGRGQRRGDGSGRRHRGAAGRGGLGSGGKAGRAAAGRHRRHRSDAKGGDGGSGDGRHGNRRGRGRMPAAFMPSATPWDTTDAAGAPTPGASRLLHWSLTGTITSTAAATHATVAIEYADGDRRPASFIDHYGYTSGVLGDLGALFAAPASRSHAATVFFRPAGSWAANADWTLPLPRGEEPAAVALGARFAAVVTTAGLLRVLSLTGVQTDVCRLAGVPVTAAAAGDQLVVVTASVSGGVELAYELLRVATSTGEVVATLGAGPLRVSPRSALRWVGFTEVDGGRVGVYDSAGSLTVLMDNRRRAVGAAAVDGGADVVMGGGGGGVGGCGSAGGAHWVPLVADASAGAGCEYLWPVGITGEELIGAACYGGRSSPRVTPRPPLTPVPFTSPVIDASASRAAGRLFRARLAAADAAAAVATAVATADAAETAAAAFGDPDPRLEEEEEALEAAERSLAAANVAVDKCLLKLIEEAAVAAKGARALDYAARLSLHKSHEFAAVVANHYKLPALASRIERLAAVKDFGDDAGLTAGAVRRRRVRGGGAGGGATGARVGHGVAAPSSAAAPSPRQLPPSWGAAAADDEDGDAPVGVRRVVPPLPRPVAPASVPTPGGETAGAAAAAADGDTANGAAHDTANGTADADTDANAKGNGNADADADAADAGDDDAAVDDDELATLMPPSRKRKAPPTVLALLRAAAPAAVATGSAVAAAARLRPVPPPPPRMVPSSAGSDTDGECGREGTRPATVAPPAAATGEEEGEEEDEAEEAAAAAAATAAASPAKKARTTPPRRRGRPAGSVVPRGLASATAAAVATATGTSGMGACAGTGRRAKAAGGGAGGKPVATAGASRNPFAVKAGGGGSKRSVATAAGAGASKTASLFAVLAKSKVGS